MSAKKARTLALGRLWGGSKQERQPLARTADERTTACFREHSQGIIRILQRFTGRDDVEDAVQDAFLRLHQALARDEEIDNLRAWVCTVAKRQLISGIRRTKLEEKTYRHDLALIAEQWMDDSAVTPEDLFVDRLRDETLREAMVSSLSDLERRCLLARAEGLTLTEVGSMLDMDFRRVSEIVRGAVLKLRRHLNE